MIRPVTPLLAIADDGINNVDLAVAKMMVDQHVVVDEADTARLVLRALGCSEDWISKKLNLAFTGAWS